MVDNAVLGETRRRLGAEDAREIRFILTKQQGRFWLGVEVENAELMMVGPDDRVRRIDTSEPGLRITIAPGPCVAESQRRQQVQAGVLRRAVVHGDAAENVFGTGLGVLPLDIEITAVKENTRVDELVLEFMP